MRIVRPELQILLNQLNTGEVDHLDELHIHEWPSSQQILVDVLSHPRAHVKRIHLYRQVELLKYFGKLGEFTISRQITLENHHAIGPFYYILHDYTALTIKKAFEEDFIYSNRIMIYAVEDTIRIYGLIDSHRSADLIDYLRTYIKENKDIKKIRFVYSLAREVREAYWVAARLIQSSGIRELVIPGHYLRDNQAWFDLKQVIRRDSLVQPHLVKQRWRNNVTDMPFYPMPWHPVFVLLLWAQWRKIGSTKDLPMTDLIWRVGTTLGWPMDLLC
jgi:hypothetical protein